MVTTDEQRKFLKIYLRDHFAGSTAGVQLAARLAEGEAESKDAGTLAAFAADIAADREQLLTVMKSVDVRPGGVKAGLASIAERLGALKLNGRVVRRSPLTSIVELEAMQMAVRGKRALWETLKAATPSRAVDFDRLTDRADEQSAMLSQIHGERVLATFAESANV